MAMLWGWLKATLAGKPRYEDAAFRKFLHRFSPYNLCHGITHINNELRRVDQCLPINFADLP